MDIIYYKLLFEVINSEKFFFCKYKRDKDDSIKELVRDGLKLNYFFCNVILLL